MADIRIEPKQGLSSDEHRITYNGDEGYLDYSEEGGAYYLQMVEVREDMRRKGIAEALLRRFLEVVNSASGYLDVSAFTDDGMAYLKPVLDRIIGEYPSIEFDASSESVSRWMSGRFRLNEGADAKHVTKDSIGAAFRMGSYVEVTMSNYRLADGSTGYLTVTYDEKRDSIDSVGSTPRADMLGFFGKGELVTLTPELKAKIAEACRRDIKSGGDESLFWGQDDCIYAAKHFFNIPL